MNQGTCLQELSAVCGRDARCHSLLGGPGVGATSPAHGVTLPGNLLTVGPLLSLSRFDTSVPGHQGLGGAPHSVDTADSVT